MFKRRRPLPIVHRVKEVVWPRRGFQRSAKYIAHRLSRLPGTPYRIAAGFACGAAISFTPFLGCHFVLAALISLVIRGSVVASAFGTLVGNPWTFPFIWAWLYASGRWLLGEEGAELLPSQFSFAYIFDNPWQVLWPMTVSGVPSALVAWLAFFLPAHGIVTEYQKARRWRIRRKVMQRRKRVMASGKAEAVKGAAPAQSAAGPKGGDYEDRQARVSQDDHWHRQ